MRIKLVSAFKYNVATAAIVLRATVYSIEMLPMRKPSVSSNIFTSQQGYIILT